LAFNLRVTNHTPDLYKVTVMENGLKAALHGVDYFCKNKYFPLGAISKTPNEIMVVPVSEPVAAAHEGPEIIVYPSQGVPQTVSKVIVIPQRLPDGNGARPQTTTPLPVRVSSTISIVPLNSTAHPSSSFVSPTVSLSTSLSIKGKSTFYSIHFRPRTSPCIVKLNPLALGGVNI
jgi:hypothetical protein